MCYYFDGLDNLHEPCYQRADGIGIDHCCEWTPRSASAGQQSELAIVTLPLMSPHALGRSSPDTMKKFPRQLDVLSVFARRGIVYAQSKFGPWCNSGPLLKLQVRRIFFGNF